MSKFTLYSLIVIGMGLLILGFQSLSMITGMEYVWEDITLESLLRSEDIDSIESISVSVVKRAAIFLIETPLYMILLAVGGVMLIAGGIFGKVR